jgi:hypothetical protein
MSRSSLAFVLVALPRGAARRQPSRVGAGPGGSGRPGGAGMRGGPRGPGMRASPSDPILLNGPPTPVAFAGIVTPEPAQQERYAGLYERFMISTQPRRDSLQAARQAMGEAFESRDREGRGHEAGSRGGGGMRELLGSLEREQKTFDAALSGMLTRDQWKQYEKWREQERKAAAEEGGPRPNRRPG